MKKYRRLIAFILIVSIMSCGWISLHAEAKETFEDVTGPSAEFVFPQNPDEQIIELQRDENGNYVGTTSPMSVTTITCFLSGNTGGIDDLYEVFIRWNGSQLIQITASNLKITSLDNATTYYNKSFYIDCKLTSIGTRAIGTCYIPNSVQKVRIKTTNMKAQFLYEYVWLSTEINGTYQVN